jgi:hypothetical protein
MNSFRRDRHLVHSGFVETQGQFVTEWTLARVQYR